MSYRISGRFLHCALASLPFGALLLTSGIARATTIDGGNIINQTWSLSGSPYIVNGDITVPAGAYLTIQPGVVVQFANGDKQGSGLSTTKTELTINGTLTVGAVDAEPVTFQALTGTTASIWYGIVIGAGASQATIANAVIQNATRGVESSAPGTVLVMTDVLAQTNQYGVYLNDGTPLLTRYTAIANSYGLYTSASGTTSAGSARPSLASALIRGNTSQGVSLNANKGTADIEINQSTIASNGSYGVYISSAATGTVLLKNTIVSTHTAANIYKGAAATPTLAITNCDVWQPNAVANYTNATPGTGTFSANPIYVSTTNLRLTSNSPARFAGDNGQDIGVLPYTNDPTPGLYGVLWSNTTLTQAGSPYQVAGDLTVPPGVTLTVQPGVTVSFANTDIMYAGSSTTKGELIVRGTLVADGTAASPIFFTSTGTTAATWWGIDLRTEANSSSITYALLEEADRAIRYGSTATSNKAFKNLTLKTNTYGAYVEEGTPSFDRVLATANSRAFYAKTNGSLVVTNSILQGNSTYGVQYESPTPAGTSKLLNCTLHSNGSYNLYVSSAAKGEVHVRNSILTQSGYNVYRGATTAAVTTVTNSDVWGATNSNYTNVTPGTGCISQNPNYVAAPTNLKLQLTSVCIDAGGTTDAPDHDYDNVARPINGDGLNAAEWDMGAYEYLPAPFCGDGITSSGETCDDGSQNGSYGHCKADCSGMGEFCGDTLINGTEQCDDGNTSNTDDCPACHNAACGDGFTWAGHEACDDGNMLNTDDCTAACKVPVCGDTFVWAGHEDCDDANSDNTDGCVTGCKAAKCGDGFVRTGMEQCDDGNTIDNDGCTNGCKLPACGDGIQQPGEQCDDGNTSNNDACASCKNATCGDGFKQDGVEECDDGNAVDTDSCLTGCKSPKCGDGFVWAGHEACDDGNTVDDDACSNLCALPGCGDNIQQTGEQCDDGNQLNTDACLATCLNAGCGDGFVWAGKEECDDGNPDNTDACVTGCKVAWCGDGFVRAGVEECDDANDANGDECVSGCKSAKCGDGFIWVGHEACDDGNQVDGDGCNNQCKVPGCGDGVQQTGEQCDDGNDSDTDACLKTCMKASCGDGFVWEGKEQCDDGNTKSGDGCNALCQTEETPDSGAGGQAGQAGAAGSAGQGGAAAGGASGQGGASTGGSAGSSTAGSGGQPEDDAGLEGGTTYYDTAASEDSGCGCRTSGSSSTSAWLLAGLGLVVAALRRRAPRPRTRS